MFVGEHVHKRQTVVENLPPAAMILPTGNSVGGGRKDACGGTLHLDGRR